MNNNTKSQFIEKQYKRLKVSQGLALSTTGHAVKSCCKTMKSALVKVKVNLNGRAYYHGLFKCGSVWDCPHCSGIISSHRKEEIEKALNIWRLDCGFVSLITYTVKHNKGHSLKEVMTACNEAYRFTKSGAPYKRFKEKYKILGSIVANEINYNEEFGWHYHRHEIVFSRSKIDVDQVDITLYKRYNNKLEELGFSSLPGIGVNISENEGDLAKYLSKWGLENELTSTKEFPEYVEASSKTPFELLDDEKDYNYFIEYSKTMHGKKRLTWSKGMKDYFGINEVEDEELIDQDEVKEDEVIKVITHKEWQYIIKNDLYLEVLRQAELGKESFDNWYKVNIINTE